ncbi:MAG: hypothetical protein QG599_1672 [Pseudomonadota bacterium]|nr:hypothetical protein [Pseudomonadota bacterium]
MMRNRSVLSDSVQFQTVVWGGLLIFMVGLLCILAQWGASRGFSPAPLMHTTPSPLADTTPSSRLETRQAGEENPNLATLALPFIANQGQIDPAVAFYAPTLTGAVYVTRSGQLVYALPKTDDGGWTLVEEAVGATPQVSAGPAAQSQINYFIGNAPARWQSGVSTYYSIELGELWPGVRLSVQARGKQVEKLFTLAPGVSADAIQMQVRGAQGMAIAEDGALHLTTGHGAVRLTKPQAWQDLAGVRRVVAVTYQRLSDNCYGFRLGDHDPQAPVVIDPLLQSTYLGGSSSEWGYALAIDPTSSDVYIAGVTSSTDFPGTASGVQPNSGGSQDAFVARLSADLKTLLQATYLGGSGVDPGLALAIYPGTAEVYLAGYTTSTDFPSTASGAQSSHGGGSYDAFVARLNANLTTLQATYLGGSGGDYGHTLAIDPAGKVYVGGRTTSTDFPGTATGAQSSHGGGTWDAFVTQLDANLTAVLMSTYLGGSGSEQGHFTLALHPTTGEVYVGGTTASADFPGTTSSAQSSFGGGTSDAFMAWLNVDLTTLLQATYLGGSGVDSGESSDIDPASGDIYLTGNTNSADFPGTTSGAQSSFGGGTNDTFIARLSADLINLKQATYLGGSLADTITSGGDQYHVLAIHPTTGEVYVGGQTYSGNFPGRSGGAQPSLSGVVDAFVARLSADLTLIQQATYLGGSDGNEGSIALAIHPTNGKVYVVGQTSSTDFPGTTGGAQPSNSGGGDAFVAWLSPKLAADSYLTVAKTGTGTGTVTTGGLEIDCGATCSTAFTVGSTVTLIYAEDIGSTFAGWDTSSDPDCSDDNVTLNTDVTCTAIFNHIPTTLTVTNDLDDLSAGSLRKTIEVAGSSDTIQFDSGLNGQTITLSGHIAIDKNLTIQGPGSGQLIIDGNNVDKIFWINSTSAVVVIDGLTLTGGSHSSGGAIDNWTGGGGDLTLKNCVLFGNSSSDIGGAIANLNRLTIDKCQLNNNDAYSDGGAIYNSGSLLNIKNSTLFENTSINNGGAIYSSGGIVTLTQSTLSGNTAGAFGGGVFSDQQVMINQSTITYNNAATGGGIAISGGTGTLTLGNSLVAGNIAANGPEANIDGAWSAQNYNLIGANGNSGLSGTAIPTVISPDFTPTVGISAIIGTLADNGGLTWTHLPLLGASGETAIDVITTSSFTTDQRGFPRPVNTKYDIGAVEASAVTSFEVTNLNDSGTGSLRQTVINANNIAGSNTITFQTGLTGVITLTGGALDITDDLTIQGPGAGSLAIDGDSASRIFTVGSGKTALIDSLTLQNGFTTDVAGGGAILNNGNLTISNSAFTNNQATPSNSFLGGGAIQNYGILTVTYSTFSNNTAVSGGAINNAIGSTADLRNSTFTSNIATHNSSTGGGGGIFSRGTLTVDYCTFGGATVANTSASDGGGLYVWEGSATVKNSTIADNTAAWGGGGIAANSDSIMGILNSTLSSNISSGGGGHGGGAIWIFTGGDVKVINSTLSGNSSPTNVGGAIENYGALSFTNSTVTNNSASSGGGIYQSGGTLKLGNTLVAGNSAATTPEIRVTGGTFISEGHNLFGQNNVDGLSGATLDPSDIIPGVGVFIGNIINDLASNGGPTKTHLPLPGGLAVNTGDDNLANLAGLTTDQRGETRFINEVEIGSVEGSFATALVITNLADSGIGSLRQAILDANTVAGANTITFQTGLTSTIFLTSAALDIDGDLTIQGPGAAILAIDGGGSPSGSQIFTVNSASTVVIDGLTLQKGYGVQGGAVFNEGNLTISNSALINNSVGVGLGGAISNAGALSIINSTLSGNSAQYGGAIQNENSGVATLDIVNSTLSGNSADYGGAIYSVETLDISNTTLSGNTSAIAGGAIYNAGALNVINSTLSGNSSGSGGGIAGGGPITIINSTVVNNSASIGGGGIYYTPVSDSLQLANSLVAGNINGEIFVDFGATLNSLGHNVFGVSSNNGISGTGVINQLPSDITPSVTLAAIVAALTNNGGPTQTHALITDSPAINAGDNTQTTAAGLTTDQRGAGFLRIQPAIGAVDIGAYEEQMVNPINGVCGAAAGQTLNSPPGSDLCLTGTPSSVTTNPGTFDWSCTGTNGGTTVACSALRGYTVTATAGTNGAIRPASQVIAAGQQARLNLKPRKGYIATVSGCAGTLTANLYTTAPISADCEVTATFGNEPYPLLVTVSPGGKVTSDPAGIDCGADCRQTYVQGTSVTLTATPDPDALFSVWSGACVGANPVCTVTMSAAKNAVATFELIADTPQRLTVAQIGVGSGRIVSTPAGIDCGSDCWEDYAFGTTVTLIAEPEAGSTFGGWLGSSCSGQGPCQVTMDHSRAVTATFNLAASHTFSQ